jgi:hypothetical protein
VSDLVFQDGIPNHCALVVVWLVELVHDVKGRPIVVCIFSYFVGHEGCFDARIFGCEARDKSPIPTYPTVPTTLAEFTSAV